MQPTGAGGRRSFLVLDEGELDGTFGYWAEDEEDGTEGFLDALDDVFWVYDDQNFSWFQRRFQGRRARKGKGKGRRKGKGKGRSGRRFFRPRGKGKGKRRGKGHFADEQQTTYPEEYFEENPYEDTWESNQGAYDAILAEDMNDYLQGEYDDANDFWQQLEEAWFSHKGKGKGKRKGKKGKGKDKGDGKQDANYANQQQPRSLPAPSRTSQASGGQQGFFAHCVTAAAEVHDSEVDLLSGMMTSCQDEADCVVNNGETIFDDMSAPVRYSLSKEMLTDAPDGFALMSAEEEVKEMQAISFLTENRFPPTIAILDIGCTRAMGSRRAVDHFCNYVDNHPDCGLWYSFESTKSKFYFANSQKATCSQKLVIYMYDRAWTIHHTEFDIVEEGEVPLLMSLPQMRNLGFELRLTPQHAYLTSVPLGIKFLELKVAASTHLVLDFQDIAWYLSDVRLQARREKSFYSHFTHYEYGHISVDHNSDEDEAEHAYPVVDYWEVDVHKRELIRHHKDYRKILFPATKSCPVDTDLLEDLRLTIIKKKEGGEEIKKIDDWRKAKWKDLQIGYEWRGRTIFKFKPDAKIPDLKIRKAGIEHRGIGDPDAVVRSSSEKVPIAKDREPGFSSEKEGAPASAAEKPVPPKFRYTSKGFDPFWKGHKSKPSEPQNDLKGDDLEEYAPSEPPERPEGELVEIPKASKGPSSDKHEPLEPGDGALEPRRISIPLPGSEVVAMTPAYRKMLQRLEDKVELYKLHVKHYHMSPTQFRRRVSMLKLPDSVLEKYESVVRNCRVCNTSVAPPPRARVSGIRASCFGDVVFADHCEVELHKNKYIILLVLDGATNLLWATAQKDLIDQTTIQALRQWSDENNCVPKAIVGDEAFFTDAFVEYYRFHGIQQCPCGPRTPWPNRAETAVRLFKRMWHVMKVDLDDPRFRGVTVREVVKKVVWARNCQLTISGYSPIEIATGRRPPDLFDLETASPEQLSANAAAQDRTNLELQRVALRAHQEARQAQDLRADLARRTMPSDGPYFQGEKVFVWTQDSSKFKDKGRWVRATVLGQEGAMVQANTGKAVIRVNQSKVRRDHDEWHDVSIPALDDENPENLREDHELYVDAEFGEQSFFFCNDDHPDVVELLHGNSGLSWFLSKNGVKVASPMDFKAGYNFSTMKGQDGIWQQLERLQPHCIVINNPSPKQNRASIWLLCCNVIEWQLRRKKHVFVTVPKGNKFCLFLQKFISSLKDPIFNFDVNMNCFCYCPKGMSYVTVFHSYASCQGWKGIGDCSFQAKTVQATRSNQYFKDPDWKKFPFSFLVEMNRFLPYSETSDKRQSFLIEDLLENFDSGSLCGTALLLEREAHQSILLNSVRTEETTEIPVPLRHILPQRFTTTELIRTLRQVDALPQRSEFDVTTSSDSRIVSLIPGLKEIRRRTLPQMYFERCKVYRGTFGRVHPLFNSEDDAVLIMWKPGKYHQVFFMFVSQLSPHHEQFLVDHWSMIVYEAETTGAVKRIVTPDEVALEDPKDQPPDYGPPMDDDMAYEPIPVSGEQQYFDPDDEDMYPPGDGPGGNPDDHQGGQPPGPPPTGSVAGPNQFGNPDVPLEQLGYPSSDPEEAMPEITSESRPPDDPGQPPIGFPSDTDPVHPFVPSPDSNTPEPEPYVPENRERHSKHMRKLSVDSTDALPKAKVKFQVKRSKVQLPGHDEPIPAPPKSVPRSFFPGHSENPTASSSNQPQAADIPVPTSTVEDDDNETIDTNETDSEPIFDEEDVKGFEKDPDKDLDDEKNLFVSFDDMDFCVIGPNQAPPSFNSYDPKGFSQFCQYLAKTMAKKTPKAESVITPEVLRKYAKEIKQAKLEEFRSFLDFTAMKYRDRRKHKIDNYVTGRWVLTIKIDKDGNFKKFKARWVCRGFQDAQKWDLQTDSPTATRYGFRVACQHAASSFWDLLHIDLKTAFLQGELYDLERRVIHVQLPTDIGLPPYLVGLCTRSVYGLSDAPRRWWNRLDKFLHSLGLVPTRADRCTYVCYSGCLRVPKAVNYSSEEMPAEPEPVSFYVAGAPPNEFHDTAEEVRRSFLCEERLFSVCYGNRSEKTVTRSLLKAEDGKWTPVVDQELQNFLDSVEHKAGWHQYANGHAQVAYRAKALRTPEPTYSRSRFCFRTSIVKRKGVWWLLETNKDIRNEKNAVTLEEEAETLVSLFLPAEHTYTVTQTPQLTPEVVEELLEHFMDPVHGSNSKNRSPIGMCCLHVDDLFVTGNDIFLKQFKDIVKSQFKIGHEDTNDLMFTGQRVAWKMQEKTKKKEYISVEQSLCVQELTEIIIPKGLKDEEKCDKDMHTAFRSLLGSINWLQSRTQFQACYQFSRSASASAGPTIGDCKALNKLCKQIVTDPMELRFWPLEGSPRLIAMPDAAFRNNSDKSSQRAMVIFMGEQRKAKQKNTKGSLIFFESSKIKRTTLSTTVAELYAFMKCYGTCQMLRGLIKDITGYSTDIHMRTDANNLVTTASTTHVPEQQETIHMIQMLRKEACSGAIADLSHIRTQWCLADCLTKKSASPQALIDAVRSGCLKEVDAHPPFRSLIEHKAYLRGWLPTVCTHVDFSHDVFYLGDSLH